MIRLEEKPFELEGKVYTLRCNMTVLEVVEEKHGDLDTLMQMSVRDSSLELLTAMLNDYAEEQGWEIRWEPAALKRKISYAMLRELDLTGMLFRSLSPAASQPKTDAAPEPAAADSGN